MSRTLAVALVLVTALAVQAGPAQSPLAGTWTGSLFGEEVRVVLGADGRGDLMGDPVTWRVQGAQVVFTSEGEDIAYTWQLQGRTLTLSGGDLVVPLSLTRSGGAPGASAGGSAASPAAAKADRPAAAAPAPAPAKPGPSAPASFLAGHYWYYSGSSGYSTEKKLVLCSDGSFNFGGESGGSGRLTNQYGDVTATYGAMGTQGGQGGWSAKGDRQSGTLVLRHANGQVEEVAYVVSRDRADQSGYGPAVTFGGTKYQRTGDGRCR